MSSEILSSILGLALLFCLGAIALLVLFKPKVKGMSSDKFKVFWNEIEKYSRSGDLAGLKQAIINADKLLDAILKTRVSGQNLGSRLRNAKSIFQNKKNYHNVWEAHKLRNKLVHEMGFSLSRSQAKKSLADYRRAFRDLGY